MYVNFDDETRFFSELRRFSNDNSLPQGIVAFLEDFPRDVNDSTQNANELVENDEQQDIVEETDTEDEENSGDDPPPDIIQLFGNPVNITINNERYVAFRIRMVQRGSNQNR